MSTRLNENRQYLTLGRDGLLLMRRVNDVEADPVSHLHAAHFFLQFGLVIVPFV